MRTKKLVEMIKEIAKDVEKKRLNSSSHHSTKYKRNSGASNHSSQVKLAETEDDDKEKKYDDDVDHRPDVVDTSPTLNSISQAR